MQQRLRHEQKSLFPRLARHRRADGRLRRQRFVRCAHSSAYIHAYACTQAHARAYTHARAYAYTYARAYAFNALCQFCL